MHTSSLLVVVLLLVTSAVLAAPSGKRLIKLAENESGAWMSAADIDDLAQARVGFIDVTDHQRLPTTTAPPEPPALPNQPQQKAYVRSLLPKLEVSNIKANVETLSSFYTRYYSTQTGVQAAEWIYQTLRAYSGGRKDISVSFFNHTWAQPSVIARIDGAVSSDLVILGSHEDSINKGALGQAPGVDDDGSGTTCVLEVFRTLVSNGFKPNRTVEFHFYAAEEVGLKGSQAIAESYYAQNKVVVGMMQLDMTFWVGSVEEVGVVVDFVDKNLTQFTRDLVDAYSDIPWVDTVCGYGCSDHASWNKYNYRSTFPFESRFSDSNPYIHSTQDTLAHANLQHGLEFAKIGLGLIVELAATTYNSRTN